MVGVERVLETESEAEGERTDQRSIHPSPSAAAILRVLFVGIDAVLPRYCGLPIHDILSEASRQAHAQTRAASGATRYLPPDTSHVVEMDLLAVRVDFGRPAGDVDRRMLRGLRDGFERRPLGRCGLVVALVLALIGAPA